MGRLRRGERTLASSPGHAITARSPCSPLLRARPSGSSVRATRLRRRMPEFLARRRGEHGEETSNRDFAPPASFVPRRPRTQHRARRLAGVTARSPCRLPVGQGTADALLASRWIRQSVEAIIDRAAGPSREQRCRSAMEFGDDLGPIWTATFVTARGQLACGAPSCGEHPAVKPHSRLGSIGLAASRRHGPDHQSKRDWWAESHPPGRATTRFTPRGLRCAVPRWRAYARA